MTYDQTRYEAVLELDKIRLKVASYAHIAGAKEALLSVHPVTEEQDAARLLEETDTALQLIQRYGTPPLYRVADPISSVKRASSGGCLSMGELLRLCETLRGARELDRFGQSCQGELGILSDLFAALIPQKSVEDRIQGCIISEDQMADSASSKLSDIRRQIRQADTKARQVLEHLVRSSTHQKYLQEQIITQRDGRFVLPVKSEHKAEIPGLVHDSSGSGATLFIEPLAVVEANNKIRELQQEEKEEIRKILEELSREVALMEQIFLSDYKALCALDVIFSRAAYGAAIGGMKPALNSRGRVNLRGARHPLIPKDQVVPIDIHLGKEFDTLVITGPNTGGKTVSLKTLGLLSMMAACGLLLPCKDQSEVCIFEKILASIGDEQSIEQSLSTFSAHMTHIVSILEEAGPGSLVLLDELGSGTDPVEGAALAVEILQQLRAFGAITAATTHYAELKLYALETAGVENACCEFDVETLSPTYRLLIGVPGRSNAFAISRRLGLSEKLIQRAKDRMSAENTRFEDVVSSLELSRIEAEKERRETEKLRQEAQKLKEETEQIRAKLETQREAEIEKGRREAKRLSEEIRRKGQEMIDELEALRKAKTAADLEQRTIRARQALKQGSKELSDLADPVKNPTEKSGYLPAKDLKVGDEVLMVELGTTGVVAALPDSKGRVKVRSGSMSTTVPLSGLMKAEKQPKKKKPTTSVRRTVSGDRPTGGSMTEVMLLGMNVEEALMELDRFLDRAAMSHIQTVRIVHGKGSGILRSAVQKHLKHHKQVAEFRLGVYGEGENGVTIATLK